jgi:molybdopterin-synthase adenylyltransferase
MKSMFSKSKPFSVTYRCKPLKVPSGGQESVSDRQERVPGFCQEALSTAKVYLVGGGGVGTEVGEGLVRKGVGELIILDPDVVEPSNLSRQLFYAADIGKNKALCLAKNLSREGFFDTRITGYALRFEEADEQGIDLTGSVAIVGVDNTQGRIAASAYYHSHNMPVIFTAVDEAANHGYVFVQEPGKACFACLFPNSLDDKTFPCPGTPAVKDILKVVGGMVIYALDSLLMKRPRCWNFKSVYLDGSIPGSDWQVERRDDCKLCQSRQLVTF